MSNLIEIKQLPIITEQLATIGEEIDTQVATALELECNDETVKKIKVVRADLNKVKADLEARRIEVKNAILAPYNAFEDVYKSLIGEKLSSADKELARRIAEVENMQKEQKRAELRDYYEEYAVNVSVDFANFNRWNPNITLSASMKSLKEQAKAYLDKIADDIELIDTQEHRDEIMVEYRETLNASRAITTVTDRHKVIEEQAARRVETAERKAAEAEVVKRFDIVAQLTPPSAKVCAEPVHTLKYSVTATLPMLRKLKKFMDDGGYKYE